MTLQANGDDLCGYHGVQTGASRVPLMSMLLQDHADQDTGEAGTGRKDAQDAQKSGFDVPVLDGGASSPASDTQVCQPGLRCAPGALPCRRLLHVTGIAPHQVILGSTCTPALCMGHWCTSALQGFVMWQVPLVKAELVMPFAWEDDHEATACMHAPLPPPSPFEVVHGQLFVCLLKNY